MFERYTERARQVVVLAQDESRALKHNYIGTEHLLLGLLREETGLACRVLESMDITLEEVRAQVARIVGPGELTTGQIPFTPRGKKVLEMSLREALSLGHNYIGTEHILLGLVRENEGVAARILLDFDADAGKIRNEIIRMLSGPPRSQAESPPLATGLKAAAVQVEEFGATIKDNPFFELVAAAHGVMEFLRLSTEEPPPINAVRGTPSQGLRREADRLEKQDKAIRRFRRALNRHFGT